MKSSATRKTLPPDYPKTPEEWEAVAAAAPRGKHRYDPAEDAYDPNDPEAVEAFWKDAVVMPPGSTPADIREAIATRKRSRGPGKKPAKALVSLRIPQDTLASWKASGPGWQTRMADVLAKGAPGKKRSATT